MKLISVNVLKSNKEWVIESLSKEKKCYFVMSDFYKNQGNISKARRFYNKAASVQRLINKKKLVYDEKISNLRSRIAMQRAVSRLRK